MDEQQDPGRLVGWWRDSHLRSWWRGRSPLGKIGWPFLALLVIAGLFGDAESRESGDIGRSTSIDMCQEAVRSRLKAPSTAGFSDESYRAPQSHKRLVGGRVDAENSFGAKLRRIWACTLRRDESGWRVDEVTIQ